MPISAVITERWRKENVLIHLEMPQSNPNATMPCTRKRWNPDTHVTTTFNYASCWVCIILCIRDNGNLVGLSDIYSVEPLHDLLTLRWQWVLRKKITILDSWVRTDTRKKLGTGYVNIYVISRWCQNNNYDYCASQRFQNFTFLLFWCNIS